jgi:hypothetical protein
VRAAPPPEHLQCKPTSRRTSARSRPGRRLGRDGGRRSRRSLDGTCHADRARRSATRVARAVVKDCIAFRRAELQAKPPPNIAAAATAALARSEPHTRHRTASKTLEPHGPASEPREQHTASRQFALETGCRPARQYTQHYHHAQHRPESTRRRRIRRTTSPFRPSIRRLALQT